MSSYLNLDGEPGKMLTEPRIESSRPSNGSLLSERIDLR
jgi:hypothetical protein